MYFPGDPNIDYKNSIKLNIRGLSFYIRDTYEMKLKIEDKVSMDYFEECINWVLAMDGPNSPLYDNDTTWEDGDVNCLWFMSKEIREKAFIDRGKLYKSDIQTFVDGVFTVGLRSSNRVLFKGLVQYYTYEWNEKACICLDGENCMEIFRKNCIEDFKEFEKYMEDSLITLADSLKYTFRFTRIV